MATYLMFFECDIIRRFNDIWFEHLIKNSIVHSKIECSFIEEKNKDLEEKIISSVNTIFNDCELINYGKVSISLLSERYFDLIFILFKSKEELFNILEGSIYPIGNSNNIKKKALEIRNFLSNSSEIMVVSRYVPNIFVPEKLKETFRRIMEKPTKNKKSINHHILKTFYQNWENFPFLIEFQTNVSLDFKEKLEEAIQKYYDILSPSIDEKGTLSAIDFSFCDIKFYSLENFDREEVAKILAKSCLGYVNSLYLRIFDIITSYRDRIEHLSRNLNKFTENILEKLYDQISELKRRIFEEHPLLFIQVIDRYIINKENNSNPDLIAELFGYYNSYPASFKKSLELLNKQINTTQSEIRTLLNTRRDKITLVMHNDSMEKGSQTTNALNFRDAFNSALENKGYVYLEPMNKHGGWAEIYYVYSKEDKIVRIAKVYNEPLGLINKENYQSDAKKLMNIDHENVVKILDKGIIEYEGENYFFLIMELIRGKSFEEIDSRILFERPYNERLGYFVQALNGVNEFRENFELHRDLHPGNIMLSDEDINKERRIKIIDPGSSRYSYEPEEEDVDLFYIKESFINLFLRPEEINNISKRKKIKDLEFPEFRELIIKLNEEEERKLQSERTNYEVESADADLIVDRLDKENEMIHQVIHSIDSKRKHLDFSFFAVPISLHPNNLDFNDNNTVKILKEINADLVYRNPYGGMCSFDKFLKKFEFQKDWYQSDYLFNGDLVFNFGRTKIYKKGTISMTIAVDASPVKSIQNSIFLLERNEKTLNSLWINAKLLAYLIMMWLKLVRSIYTKLDFQGSLKLILDIYSGWDLSLVKDRTLLLGNSINPRSEINIKISELRDSDRLLKIIQSFLKELLRFFGIDIDEFEQGYELFRDTIEEYFSMVFK